PGQHREEALDVMLRGLCSVDGECVFPFWYRKEKYYDCVKLNAKHKWCSLNTTFSGYWKYCAMSDFAPCAFPFWYRRLIYRKCTEDGEVFGRKWCSLTPDYNRDQVWKYC
ncbi:PREDICTED: binder of sperm protein homolog 1-like, partial [Dipodomys ordii]|uniref:Binder of sperm protein homolog 1-like n=1 Tax=Dipodomys ordii TaxID=10020 RepID=A0A1S3GVP6_DIPOR